MINQWKKILTVILVMLLAILFVLFVFGKAFEKELLTIRGTPNRAVTLIESDKARIAAERIFLSDFGIKMDPSDCIPFMAHQYMESETLFLFEPHEGFDYNNFVEILLSDRYHPKGYIVNRVVDSSTEARRSAAIDGRYTGNRHPNLSWWRPDELSDDIQHITIRIVREDEIRSQSEGREVMSFYLSRQDGRIYARRNRRPFSMNVQER